MGSECSPDERETRYMSFHQAIYAIENDIKKEIDNPDLTNKKYMPFGLVNQGLCKEYNFLLNPNFDKNEARNIQFNYKYLVKNDEDRDFSYINPRFEFSFPSKFMFINKDFMDVIRDNVPEKYKNHLKTNFDTIIGGGCLIMRDPRDKKDENPFRYIILYNEIKENKGNEIDFFLFIKDREKRNSAVNYILEHNLLNFFKKIEYNYKDEYKKVSNENKKEIGYIVRCSEISRVEAYISKMEQKKKNESNISKPKRSMSVKTKIQTRIIPQNNNEPNIKNNPINIFSNPIQNNMQNIRMSFNQNQRNIDNNINNNNFQNFQNFQIPMNMMNNMNFNNMNNNSINNFLNNNNMNIQYLHDQINYLKNENENLKKTIKLKEEENNELKLKIDNLENNKPEFVNAKQIRVVQFVSDDRSMICGINCLLSDTFAEVEEKLYKIYPEYRETNNSFQVDGRNILRFKTIAENNIQTGHFVQITRIY